MNRTFLGGLSSVAVGLSVLVLGCGAATTPSPQKTQQVSSKEASSPAPQLAPMDTVRLSYGLRGREEDFRKCFMRSMESRGKVNVQFSVDDAGTVHGARVVASSLGQSHVEQCLVDELLGLDFGNQPAPSVNQFTFVFRLTDPLSEKQRKALLQKAKRQSGESLKILPESRGTIDLNHVAEIVEAGYPLYAHCYRDSIQRRGESRGLVRFRLHINEAGSVFDLQDEGSIMPDPFAVDCMAEAFYLMRFEAPTEGPTTLRYTMELE
jgi:hypothetical protein